MYDKTKSERAQLIIITAFIIAITFLLLATLLNVVIYAENQAARGLTVAEQSGYETQTEMNETFIGLLEQTNTIRNTSYTPYETSIREGVNETAIITKTTQSKQQKLVQTELQSIDRGTQIIQNDSSREYTSAGGATNWNVVVNSPATRDMNQTVNRASLYQHTNSSQYLNESLLSSKQIFQTDFTDSSGTWEVYVVELAYNNTVLIRSVDPSGVIANSCYRSASTVTIDYADQTANGADCDALSFVNTLNTPHTITYQNGQNAEGVYQIHTSRDYGLIAAFTFESPTSGNSPYATPSIYSMTYYHAFASGKEQYDTTTRIAPNELTD